MFTMKFDTGNAAFMNDYTGEPDVVSASLESARILRNIADKLEALQGRGVIHDINGNQVGTWQLK